MACLSDGCAWIALPPDAWRVVATFCNLAELGRLHASNRCGTSSVALGHSLENLRELDFSRVLQPSSALLRRIFERCPQATAVLGLYCASLTLSSSVAAAGEEVPPQLPRLPPSCRRLALRLSDSWSVKEVADFLQAMAAWVAPPLEHLTVLWNPQDDASKKAAAAAQAVEGAWQCFAVRSLFLHRAPQLLGRGILQKSLHHGCSMQAAHLVDVAFPAPRGPFWERLTELSYTYEKGPAAINDGMLRLLAQAAPPLRILRLVDRHVEDWRPSVTIDGLVAMKPIFQELAELRLSRVFGAFCDASDIDLLMFLEGALGPGLVHLDLEGFPRLSDSALLEMVSGIRTSPLRKGLEVLRILSTSVSDAAFVNGLDEALAPSLRELRLSSNTRMGDGPLLWLAEAGRCSALERLTLGGASFCDSGFLAVVSTASNLRALHLREISLSDGAFAALPAGTPHLQELGLSGIYGAGDASLQAMHGLPLASLRLANCPGFTSLALSELLDAVGPGSLASLSLEHCAGVCNSSLQGLSNGGRWPRLQHLRLIGVKVSGVILSWFGEGSLPELRRLELWRAKWPDRFRQAEALFRATRPEVVLSVRRTGGALGWTNW